VASFVGHGMVRWKSCSELMKGREWLVICRDLRVAGSILRVREEGAAEGGGRGLHGQEQRSELEHRPGQLCGGSVLAFLMWLL
jgi:hypothetical protein